MLFSAYTSMCLLFSFLRPFRFTVIQYLRSRWKNLDKLNTKTNAYVLLSMSIREYIASRNPPLYAR